eukprot:g1246.t1
MRRTTDGPGPRAASRDYVSCSNNSNTNSVSYASSPGAQGATYSSGLAAVCKRAPSNSLPAPDGVGDQRTPGPGEDEPPTTLMEEQAQEDAAAPAADGEDAAGRAAVSSIDEEFDLPTKNGEAGGSAPPTSSNKNMTALLREKVTIAARRSFETVQKDDDVGAPDAHDDLQALAHLMKRMTDKYGSHAVASLALEQHQIWQASHRGRVPQRRTFSDAVTMHARLNDANGLPAAPGEELSSSTRALQNSSTYRMLRSKLEDYQDQLGGVPGGRRLAAGAGAAGPGGRRIPASNRIESIQQHHVGRAQLNMLAPSAAEGERTSALHLQRPRTFHSGEDRADFYGTPSGAILDAARFALGTPRLSLTSNSKLSSHDTTSLGQSQENMWAPGGWGIMSGAVAQSKCSSESALQGARLASSTAVRKIPAQSKCRGPSTCPA